MRKKSISLFITVLAVMLCMAAFSVNALAYGGEPSAEPTATSTASETPAITSTPTAVSETSSSPLTPDGTGTVIDNVTNEDGKEFFTITTPSKHVFYLIIDRQKDTENVYFLDAVAEKDLLALAESDGESSISTSSKVTEIPEASSSPVTSTPASTTTAQPEKQNNAVGIATVVLLLTVIAGAAIWLFRFRKPKSTAKGKTNLDEYDFPEDYDEEDELDTEPALPAPGKPDFSTPEKGDDE